MSGLFGVGLKNRISRKGRVVFWMFATKVLALGASLALPTLPVLKENMHMILTFWALFFLENY